MATYKSAGNRIDYTPTSAAVAAGAVVVQNTLVGVANEPIAQNALGALDIDGIFAVAKATGTGTGILAGKVVYYKADPGQATEASTGNTRMGVTVLAAADAEDTVLVKLNV